jgi:hypothetical protein
MTELRVICTIAGQWGRLTCETWSHPAASEPVAKEFKTKAMKLISTKSKKIPKHQESTALTRVTNSHSWIC